VLDIWCYATFCRLFDVVNDLKQHRMYLIFEYLDGDLYRLMQVGSFWERTLSMRTIMCGCLRVYDVYT